MNLTCWWQILLFGLWIQVGIVPVIHCKDGTPDHLSREADALFLLEEQNPECFTRTLHDFTCFFGAPDNRTYDFFYEDDFYGWKRCELSVQRTEEGNFLHICSFPESDVQLYVGITFKVVEHRTNTILYTRTVSVEDHVLLDPPFNVSLQQNGNVGQLQVSWHSSFPKYTENAIFRIRFSSTGLGEKKREEEKWDLAESKDKDGSILDSLTPGEEVMVQVAAKSRLSGVGHWSRWSHRVRAVVPQSADDISLMCYTADLRDIICQWNGSRYGDENEYTLFYKMNHGKTSAWTEWTECLADTCQCPGQVSTEFRVKLSSSRGPHGRTFYTQGFALNKRIKTFPPNLLKATMEKGKLCMSWEAPLPSLAAHLVYEVNYRIRGGDEWKVVVGETAICQAVPTSSQFSVKVRARPSHPFDSDMWSDWSPELTSETPADPGMLVLLCIPVSMFIIVIMVVSLSPKYLGKLKLYFWPPVPNLDKVLQGFLTEINGERWKSPLAVKQCCEDTPPSVVEIMSEGEEVPGLDRPAEESKQLLSADSSLCSGDYIDESRGPEAFPDYVTLNKNSSIHIPQGNGYIEGHAEGEGKEGSVTKDPPGHTCHTSCSGCSMCIPPCLTADFLNQSYMPQAQCADACICKVTTDRSPGNLYTNFPPS